MTKCAHCGRKAVFELRYSGIWICRKHFIELFERRVKKTIRQNRLLSKGDFILVGLSGGKDSMTVLKILSDIVLPVPGMRIMAVTIDEGIRGKSLKRCIGYCRKIGVEHRMLAFKERYGLNIDDVMDKVKADGVLACSVCGVLKRRVFNDFAKEAGATKVATGHNLDDEIQAAFMNIVRGDLQRMARLGSEVGASRHKAFVPRIKILRECPEEEVRLYADLMKLPYSRKRCPYSRTSYRTSAKNLLNALEAGHAGSKYQMLRSVDGFAAIMRERTGGEAPKECEKCGEPSSGDVCKACTILERLAERPTRGLSASRIRR
jgi:uncharacterized protein (TIGR00269 family)